MQKWTIEIKRNHHIGEWHPGMRIEVSPEEAKSLIDDGHAVLVSRPSLNDVLKEAPSNRAMGAPVRRDL